MKGSLVAAVLVGGLVLGLLGGLLGSQLFPPEVDTGDLEGRLSNLEARVASLEGQVGQAAPGGELRLAYVDAEGLFIRVFLPQVEAERQAMAEKQAQLQELQRRFLQGELTQEEYQQQAARTQVEILQAQLQVNLTMLDKMIASPGFADFRSELQAIQAQAQSLEASFQQLASQVEVAILDMQDFLSDLQQLQLAFQQLDQLLTQAAAAKIVQVAQAVGREGGYDLVLRKKDVVIYYNPALIVDISAEVEVRLRELFVGL